MNKYAHRVWIALALLVAALGMRGLNADAIWYDEWWSLYYAGAIDGDTSPGAVLARLSEQRQHENNPPLYYLLLAQWGQLLNWTPQTAPLIGRFLSLAATLLAGAFAFRAGRLLAGQTAGLSAYAVFLSSAFIIHYAHELRGYALSAFFTAAAIWAYLHLRVTRHRWRTWAALAASLTAMLYTHYFTGLGVVALGLVHALRRGRSPGWWSGLLAFAVAGAAFLLWLPNLAGALNRAIVDPVALALTMQPPEVIWSLLFSFSNANPALALLLIGVALQSRDRRQAVIAGWVIILTALILILNARFHLVSELRYLIGLWAGLALWTAFGITSAAKRGLPAALVITIWAAAGLWTSLQATPLVVALNAPDSGQYTRVYNVGFIPLPFHDARRLLERDIGEDDVLLLHRPDTVWAIERLFEYYFGDLPGQQHILETTPDAQLQASIQQARRIWLAIDETTAPGNRLPWLQQQLHDAGFARCGDPQDLGALRLERYETTC
ncbi:MAG: glycosyltransferase family 39 protein [Chloroflexota bacterium]